MYVSRKLDAVYLYIYHIDEHVETKYFVSFILTLHNMKVVVCAYFLTCLLID